MASDTTPKIGHGTVVTWNAHDIGYLLDIKGPSIKADKVDVTNQDSADRHREYIAGLIDGGEISLDVLLIPGDVTGQATFITDVQAGTEREVVITLPDGSTTWTADAIPVGYDPSYPNEGEMKATLTMQVTGKPVFAIV